MKKKTNKDKIKGDLRLGKQFDVLALKYSTSENYIRKVYKEMKDAGENLPDRKTKKWKTMQILRKKEYVDDEEDEFGINDIEV